MQGSFVACRTNQHQEFGRAAIERLMKGESRLHVGKFLRIAALTLVVLLALLAAGAVYARNWVESRLLAPNPAATDSVLVEITPGLTTADVANLLQRKGLIRHAIVFRYYARYLQMDSQLQGGRYELSAAMTPQQILKTLAEGLVQVRRFTVPEGLTLEELADSLVAQGIVSNRARFLSTAAASNLANKYMSDHKPAHPLEGYLFPSTYDYHPGITDPEIIAMMFRRFEQIWTPELLKKAKDMDLTVHEVVTLASIIEEEAQQRKESPRIAGVYQNRLAIGMKLDADPTIRYALKKPYSEPLLFVDLEFESPYNTYRNAGLPPGPISAPGESSIKAALNPEKHDYWYFVAKADGSGEHYFSNTLDEHENLTLRAADNSKKKAP